MQVSVKRKPLEKCLASGPKEKDNPNPSIFKPPKFDTDLQNYFYYTEVYKDWFQPK
jgi:hypothetical protein